MLRKLLGAGLLLATLAGCTDPEGRPCASDEQCGPAGVCDTTRGYCYAAGTEPELDPSACSPTCAEYEACTKTGCKNRFTGVSIETPSDNALLNAGSVQVVARLEVNETYKDKTRFPGALAFSAQQVAGGEVGSFGNQSSDDAGTYRIAWSPPLAETQITLIAEYTVPDAGLRDSVNVTVDRLPPVFTVSVPPFDAGVPDGGTSYADPNPGGFSNPWPRDQQVPVELRTNEPNLDPGSVRVALRGTDNVPGTAVPVSRVTAGCDAGFCGVAVVNLWEPRFDAFRGTLGLDVQGQDRAGNLGSTSPSAPQVNVTRWKWAFNVPGATISATPAVGEQGTVYLGTTAASEGKVFALRSDGTKQWETPVGPVAGLAVGAFDGGVESIYVAANTASNRAVLYALSSTDGGTTVRCPSGTSEHTGQVRSAVAVTTTGTAPDLIETGMAIVNNAPNTRLYLIRPELSGSDQCVASNPGFGLPNASQDSSVAVNGTTLFYPTATASIVGYTIFGSAVDWTASTGATPVYGLALSGGTLVGGASGAVATSGGLYSVPVTGGTTATLLSGTAGGRIWNPIIGPGGVNAFFGQDTGDAQGELEKYDLPNKTMARPPVPNVGVLRYAPALGSNEVLYTAASSDAVVTAWNANDFSQRWTVTLGAAASSASVTLDCARNASGAVAAGKPGTLYVPAGGTLYAISADSPGLNRDALAWPKFQHDARNTGNAATPITTCP